MFWLMAGLLLVDLSATKNWARTIRCTANCRQFALARLLYAQDHLARVTGGKFVSKAT